MRHGFIAAVAALLFPASAAFSQSAVDDEWNAAREKAFNREGAREIMEVQGDKPAPDGFRLTYAPCDEADDACLFNQAEAAVSLPYAYRGVYTAQRNLAFCLDNGCQGSIIPKQELSCAWRIVIAASGHPDVDAGDQMNLESCIEKLGSSGGKIARSQAAKLYRVVYGEPLPNEWR